MNTGEIIIFTPLVIWGIYSIFRGIKSACSKDPLYSICSGDKAFLVVRHPDGRAGGKFIKIDYISEKMDKLDFSVWMHSSRKKPHIALFTEQDGMKKASQKYLGLENYNHYADKVNYYTLGLAVIEVNREFIESFLLEGVEGVYINEFGFDQRIYSIKKVKKLLKKYSGF